jgi:hypothetical protein
VLCAWRDTETHYAKAGRNAWLAMFRSIGYTHAGERAEPPTERITLYRGVNGATVTRGMAWTSDLHMAKWFATRFPERVPHVYQSTPPVSSLLAFIDLRGESEYVIDPRGIKVTEIGPDPQRT